MVNQQLVEYIRKYEQEGRTDETLRVFLIKDQGFSEQEVDEAIRVVHGNQQEVQNTPSQNSSPKNIKKRNPFLVFILSFITFGIYIIYWFVSTTKELRRSGEETPHFWLLIVGIIPLLGFPFLLYFLWKYLDAVEKATDANKIMLFVVFLIIFPLGLVVTQVELNKLANN